MYQHNEAPASAGGKSNFYSIGGRGSWGLTKNLKWLTEVGYSSLKPGRRQERERDQGHRGPGAVDRPGLLEAPRTAPVRDLRGLQQGRGADTANNYNFPANKTSAVSYGAQLEIWF